MDRTGSIFEATNTVASTDGDGFFLLSEDQETLVCALEPVRNSLGEHVAGNRDAAWVVERLQSILDSAQIKAALDRLDRRRILRLVD